MDLAARPHITAGVALASAAVLAAGPMTQHLPDLRLAQHLPTASVSDINLTDAASPMIDLFSGVENQLASLANGASAAALPASVASAAFDPTQNLIVQTWINTFETAAWQAQGIATKWAQTPFVVPQQIAANWVQYASDYIGAYQEAAAGAAKYLGGTTSFSFVPLMQQGWSNILAGNISTGITNWFQALWYYPLADIGLKLEAIPGDLLGGMTTNLASATHYLTSTGLTIVGEYAGLELPIMLFEEGLANGLQATYNAWQAGDQVGAVTNLLNTPGLMANYFLNGAPQSIGSGYSGGLLSYLTNRGGPGGRLSQIFNNLNVGLAKTMVTPNAQNIGTGGSLATAVQNFANQLANGWPSLTPVANELGGALTQVLQNIPTVLSSLPSVLSNAGGLVAGQIGSWIAALLRLL
ncbi:hypothetical protein K3U93_06620 [Mycobacterium malmoense]|uniref:hypothetical protein n=1 Tax=Mycobacterium malmoense TaxID=1780 RepID=UPI00111C32EA|nr:hypothetical protein [Mycobacterium malmoense]QZA18833.1 hypothetical protein K3U93_06620 [Mycobacterium malmoense]UNB95604.1 hypothetical protein H5T25_06615 [Mycobacterium malmoense]